MKKLLFVILFSLLFLFLSVLPARAESPSCAYVEAYIIDLDTNENVPDATGLLTCTGSFNTGPNGSGPPLACSAAQANNAYGRICWFRSDEKTVSPGGPEPLRFGSSNFTSGYNCYGGNPRLEVKVPNGWELKCTTDASRNDCSGGSNYDINNLDIINGGGFVFKAFYQKQQQEVPTPTPTRPQPTATPKPGCEGSTCTYTENAPGVCPSGIRVVHGYGTTGHNQPGCRFESGCSYTECEVPKQPTPTTPLGGPQPSRTPTPTACPVPKRVPNVRVECPYC